MALHLLEFIFIYCFRFHHKTAEKLHFFLPVVSHFKNITNSILSLIFLFFPKVWSKSRIVCCITYTEHQLYMEFVFFFPRCLVGMVLTQNTRLRSWCGTLRSTRFTRVQLRYREWSSHASGWQSASKLECNHGYCDSYQWPAQICPMPCLLDMIFLCFVVKKYPPPCMWKKKHLLSNNMGAIFFF